MKVRSFNVRGMNDPLKRARLFQSFKTRHKGIIFLQETHSSDKDERLWTNEYGGSIYGTRLSKGVAICFPRNCGIKVRQIVRDNQGRYILIECEIDTEIYVLLNIYAPTKDHAREQGLFLEKIHEVLLEYQDRNIIMAGDFNVTLDPNKDKNGGKIERQSTHKNCIT